MNFKLISNFWKCSKHGSMADKLKGIQDLFSLLSRSSAKLNSLLSVPVLYALLSRIIVMAVSLFVLISSTINFTGHNPESCESLTVYLMVDRFIPSVILIGVILTATDLPVKEVLVSYACLYTMINSIVHFHIQVILLRNRIKSLRLEVFQNEDDQIHVIFWCSNSQPVIKISFMLYSEILFIGPHHRR